MALDGGSRFSPFRRSVAFSLQKPLLAGYPLARIKNSINYYFILKLN